VNDVVSDLKKLLSTDPSILSKDVVHKILRKYNTEQLFFAPDNSGDMIVVSDIGEKDSSTYFDPKQNRFLKFDHHKKTFGDISSGERKVDSNIEDYRKAIQLGIEDYASESFTSGKYAAATYASPNGVVTMIVTAKNLNLRNFWSGGWRSVYTVDVSRKGNVELKGVIKLNVHYFEDGNVQLTTELKSSTKVKIESADKTGESIGKAIDKIETDFQKNLEEFYVKMHESTFRAMRRFLPVTGQKMPWKIHGHSLAEEVTRFQ